ncbi:MAG TPA: hypothetical protein VNO32_64330, partial [Candidatus Acidoferrum sp.]|nr:hypothetical protein [Candidatus Acidoferrum sp.]
TFLAVRRIHDIVTRSDERPSICCSLEFAIFDQEYFHLSLTALTVYLASCAEDVHFGTHPEVTKEEL